MQNQGRHEFTIPYGTGITLTHILHSSKLRHRVVKGFAHTPQLAREPRPSGSLVHALNPTWGKAVCRDRQPQGYKEKLGPSPDSVEVCLID